MVIFTDDKGIIRGTGNTDIRRDDVHNTRPKVRNAYSGWIGYLPAGNYGSISAYLMFANGQSCLVGSKTVAPLALVGPELVDRAIAAISPVQTQTTGSGK